MKPASIIKPPKSFFSASFLRSFLGKPNFFSAQLFWGGAIILMALIALTPLIAISWFALSLDAVEISRWPNLWPLFFNTAGLLAGSMIGALLLGAGAAWLISFYHFFGRAFLSWMLVLPLAMPPYLLAYIYSDLLSYSGPIQTAMRDLFGWQRPSDYYFPDIHSLGGACLVMATALYPYVYVAAYSVFARRSSSVISAGRSLGLSDLQCFWKIILPLAQPALWTALILVAIECLNDIGVVEYLGVRTFSLGLYEVWINQNDFAGAIQIAVLLVGVAFGLLLLQRFVRSRPYYALNPSGHEQGEPMTITGQIIVLALCLVPLLAGFILPMSFLAYEAWVQAGDGMGWDILKMWTYARPSLALAVSSAIIITALGLLLVYGLHRLRSPVMAWIGSVAVVGYGVPGVVLGLGLIFVLTQIYPLSSRQVGDILLTGYQILLLGYVIRFLALPYGLIGAGLSRIQPSLENAARVLGLSFSEIFGKIHLPLLRPAIWAGTVLVFVEVMRELPLTLMIRPFNFETMATHIYTIASLGLLEEAALGGLVLGLIGLLPAFLWIRMLGGADRRAGIL